MVKKIMVGSEGDLVLEDNRGSLAAVKPSVISSAPAKLLSGLRKKTNSNGGKEV